jgi:halimadienyl-diphosphate synthase
VLHALLRLPGEHEQAIKRIAEYLADQHSGLYWIDKWHISPLYATAHVLAVVAELSRDQAKPVAQLAEQSREWLRQSQNADGSWGFYGQPTAEETAYGLLALCAADFDEQDRTRCENAARYLSDAAHDNFPPLWIDKCLYTPPLIVRAAIAGALNAWKGHDHG